VSEIAKIPPIQGISAAIIAGNEEANIGECIDRLDWADEIVVVCSSTADRTMERARETKARVYFRAFDSYREQRRYALEQCSHEWVLAVDADERVTDALRDEILALLERSPDCDGYRIPRRNYFVGRWMRHGGWSPDYQLRLFRAAAVTVTVRQVHEGYTVRGRIGVLAQPFDHFTDPTIRHHLAKNVDYARLEAEERRRPVGALRMLLDPLAAFLTAFVGKAGWRDGMHGVAAACIHAACRLQRNLYMWELSLPQRNPLGDAPR
jgi:glycosyltransferase involved in cell wall biosynthesis